jgi:23S rRNA pseudouridine955/2504/2580 synthase
VREITVGGNDSGQRLDRFLMKAFPLTIGVVMKALRNKDIKVNNKRAEAAYNLNEGDIIRIFRDDALLAEKPRAGCFYGVSTKLNIIYEDENIILADKPAGLLCHESGENCSDTLSNRIKAYLYGKNEFVPKNENSFEPALCNRLDRNTGGIVVAAKTAEALRVLNDKIRRREVKKLYLCILTGIPEKKTATLTAYLEKDETSNTVKITGKKTPLNKTIVTSYRVLKTIEKDGGLSLAEVDLITGRTHQIRAHMAYIGHPLLGDGKYGRRADFAYGKKLGFKFQALYAYKLVFEFKENCPLDYLNGGSFETGKEQFLKTFDRLGS